jgi:hypothetical protein
MHQRFLITKDEMLIKDSQGQIFSIAIKQTSKQILQVFNAEETWWFHRLHLVAFLLLMKTSVVLGDDITCPSCI